MAGYRLLLVDHGRLLLARCLDDFLALLFALEIEQFINRLLLEYFLVFKHELLPLYDAQKVPVLPHSLLLDIAIL